MYEALNDVGLNVVANGILFVFMLVFSHVTFEDYRIERTEQSRLFFSFEFSGAVYLLLSVVELLEIAAGAGMVALFVISIVRVFSAVLMYTFAGYYIVLLIEKKQHVHVLIKRSIHFGLIIMFLTMPVVYILSQNELLTNIPIFSYLIFLEAVIVVYRKPLSIKNSIIYSLFIIPSFLLLLQEYWNYTPANIYATLLMAIIHCEVWQKQKIEMFKIEKELVEQKHELANARISLMSSQINPHFLFNTLSSIANLCEKDSKEARYLTLEFASYMRTIANDLNTFKTIPFVRELQHTEHFINIEKVRFGKALRFDFDIEEMDFKLPPLTLQPLVENALKHGVMPKGGGLIVIETYADKYSYYIRIIDDGVGFDVNEIDADNQHLGIQNITKRLQYMCDGKLSINSEIGKGTTAVVRIPKEVEHENSLS